MQRQLSSISRAAWYLLFALLFSALCSTAAWAQFRAGIQGAVTDAQGAAVVGATVKLTSKETNRTQEIKSGDEGFYRFDHLAPGGYSMTIEISGFKKKLLENVQVKAEEVQGVNIKLDAGEVTETITISSEATAQLHTESANIGGSLSTREIQRLPQVGRDPYELVRLAPGVFGLGARSGNGNGVGFPNRNSAGGAGGNIFDTENRPEISAAGQRVESNNIQIDGVGAMSQAWGGAAVVTPNQESVKEVRILASSYSAENGRNTGAQIQVVSQNGTNAFHGSFFFKRNTPGLNSEQDFVRAGTAIRDDPQRVNQFLSQYGGSVGGPVYFPLFGEGGKPIWKGKDKLFFFFSYETVRRSSSRQEGFWIETPQYFNAVKGLGSNSIAAKIFNFVGRSRVASVDSSKNCASLGFTEGTNCKTVTGGLDIGSINPAAKRGVEQPDMGGGLDGIPDIQFAQLPIPDKNKSQQFNTRIDYQVTKNDLVAFSMYFVPSNTTFNDTWANRDRPALDFTSARRNTVGTLLWTRTLSPTMINEARFNVTRWFFDEVASNAQIGWGLPKTFVCLPRDPCSNWGGTAIGPGVFFQTTYNFRDTLSKVVNAHALKFGVDIISEQNNDKAPWAGRPEYWFGNPWSFANDAPNREHAFFDPKTGAFTDLAAYARSKYYA
ncbi:MAG: carboxypeptidase regulatory-like domain-containing protein, partial [Blastocatellia bacterium]